MAVVTTKHDRIAATIRRQIIANELRAGESIPSYRELVARHGVAVSTVRQAVGMLQTEGLIKPVPGKGCVVSAPPDGRELLAAVVLGKSNPLLILDTINTIEGFLTEKRCDVLVRYIRSPADLDLEQVTNVARRMGGVLLCGSVPVHLLSSLQETGAPCVLVGDALDGDCPMDINQVTVDLEAIVQLGFSHLTALGHRRIGLVRSAGSRYANRLGSILRECAAESPLGIRVSETIWSERGPEAKVSFESVLPPPGERPTALLVDSATRAMRIVDDLRAAGISVPGDVSVLAISEGLVIDDAHRGLSRVEVSFPRLLQRAVEIACDLHRSPSRLCHREQLSPHFIGGDTCSPTAEDRPSTFTLAANRH